MTGGQLKKRATMICRFACATDFAKRVPPSATVAMPTATRKASVGQRMPEKDREQDRQQQERDDQEEYLPWDEGQHEPDSAPTD